jgi:hypothetical protein
MGSTDLAHTVVSPTKVLLVRVLRHLACLRLLLALSVLALALEVRAAQTPLLLLEVLALNGPLEMLLATIQTTGVVRICFLVRQWSLT